MDHGNLWGSHDTVFGILINIIRVKAANYESSLIMEPLLPYQMEIEEDNFWDLGIVRKVWRFITFKLVDPVMQHGANKQLEFEDLLKLPVDMDPSFCHDMILGFWEAQQTSNFNHPSLFKTICSAYGWPCFCIGLVKVLRLHWFCWTTTSQ